MKRVITTFLLIIGLSVMGFSQILPPDFICVNLDTLIWNTPTNTCGSFNSYEIYFSANESGPYSLLETVTDQNQTSFFHATAGGNTWYYYLLSDYDCPGEMQISSDTLDSAPPEVAVIEVVTVENGEIDLSWNPSPSPETVGYIIYRETNIGVIPVDTVFGGLSYIDLGALPNNQSEVYFVNALDACGNTSIFDVPHNSIFLETSVNVCEQTILLSWNLYQNWLNPTAQYEVWLSLNGAADQLVETLDGSTDAYLYENVNDGDDYCFHVRATESNTGIISNSNIFCETIDVVQPTQYLKILNVSVLASNQIEVTYTVNSDAEIYQVGLEATQNGITSEVSTAPITPPLPAELIQVDGLTAPAAGVVSYQVSATNDCDSITFSNVGQSIFLNAEALNGTTNKLTWTPIGIEDVFGVNYEIYQIINGVEVFIGVAGATDSTFFDPIDVNVLEDAESCYLVIANAMVLLPNGSFENISSRSNISCVEQPVRLFVPNAFAPRGVNQEFKPLVVFGENSIYEMVVYDRYGKIIFRSNEIEKGWRGTINGKDANPGGYAYTIEIVQPNGERVTNNGVVVLLR